MRATLLASLDAREATGKTKKMYKSSVNFLSVKTVITITGTPPAVATTIVEAMGADIIGINCSLGPEQITPLIEGNCKRKQTCQLSANQMQACLN